MSPSRSLLLDIAWSGLTLKWQYVSAHITWCFSTGCLKVFGATFHNLYQFNSGVSLPIVLENTTGLWVGGGRTYNAVLCTGGPSTPSTTTPPPPPTATTTTTPPTTATSAPTTPATTTTPQPTSATTAMPPTSSIGATIGWLPGLLPMSSTSTTTTTTTPQPTSATTASSAPPPSTSAFPLTPSTTATPTTTAPPTSTTTTPHPTSATTAPPFITSTIPAVSSTSSLATAQATTTTPQVVVVGAEAPPPTTTTANSGSVDTAGQQYRLQLTLASQVYDMENIETALSVMFSKSMKGVHLPTTLPTSQLSNTPVVTILELVPGSTVVVAQADNVDETDMERLRADIESGASELVTVFGAIASSLRIDRIFPSHPGLAAGATALLLVTMLACVVACVVGCVMYARQSIRRANELREEKKAMQATNPTDHNPASYVFSIEGGQLRYMGIGLNRNEMPWEDSAEMPAVSGPLDFTNTRTRRLQVESANELWGTHS